MANAKVVQFRRGTTAENDIFVGAQGELSVDTDKWTVVVHDGLTPGGYPLKVEAVEYVRPRYLTMRAAIVQQGIPSLGFSAPENAPVPIAIIETSGLITGAASFSYQQGQSIQDHFMLPVDWVAPLDVELLWRSSHIIGQVNWQMELCGVPINGVMETAVFNEPQSVTTDAGNGLPYELVSSTISNLNITNCYPGGEVFFRLTRLTSDTLTTDAELLAVRFVVRVESK